MTGHVKVDGAWKSVASVNAKVDGAWKAVDSGFTKVAGNWKQFYSATPPSAYELIATTILESTTNSVTFSSLGTYSSTYKHLQLRIAAKTDRTSDTTGAIALRFNSDTATNYGYHSLLGNGSTVTSIAESSITRILFQRFGGNATSFYFGASVLDILDAYSTTKNKTTRNFGGVALGRVALDSGLWRSTDSITSIDLLPEAGTNFLTGSRFSLYGIRG